MKNNNKIQYAEITRHLKIFSRAASWTIIAAITISGCVNETSTGALTSTDIEAKQTSHEERYVAGKCNSASRLSSSNHASEILNSKLTLYSENEAKLDAATRDKIIANLQAQGTKLTELDQQLKSQCTSYSTCEFQASTTKQDCSIHKSKFRNADKQMLVFGKSLEKIKIN